MVPRVGLDILWKRKIFPPAGTMFILIEVGMGLLQLGFILCIVQE